jgi:hypothetical protein
MANIRRNVVLRMRRRHRCRRHIRHRGSRSRVQPHHVRPRLSHRPRRRIPSPRAAPRPTIPAEYPDQLKQSRIFFPETMCLSRGTSRHYLLRCSMVMIGVPRYLASPVRYRQRRSWTTLGIIRTRCVTSSRDGRRHSHRRRSHRRGRHHE